MWFLNNYMASKLIIACTQLKFLYYLQLHHGDKKIFATSFYSLNSFFILHDMHIGLKSLELPFLFTSFDTKISSITYWEHTEPNTQYVAMVYFIQYH